MHVHYALLTGLKRVKHLRLPWEEVLLANLRHDAASGWPIPAAELELIVLLVRIWAKMSPQYRLAGVRIPRTVLAELDWLRADADEQETTRIMGELKKLGITPPSRNTIKNILKEHGVEPAPERKRGTSWETFLKSHWETLGAIDFTTVEFLGNTGSVALPIFAIRHSPSALPGASSLTRTVGASATPNTTPRNSSTATSTLRASRV